MKLLPETKGRQPGEPSPVPQYLEITNFRCFERLVVALDEASSLPGRWTCIVGVNGSGKTTVLEALCLTLIGQSKIRELGGERLNGMRRIENGRPRDACLRLWLREGSVRHYVEVTLDEKSRLGSSAETAASMQEFWEKMGSKFLVAYGATRNLVGREESGTRHLSPELRAVLTLFEPLTQLPSAEALFRSERGEEVAKKLLVRLLNQVLAGELEAVLKTGKLQFVVENEPLKASDLADGFRSTVAWLADLCAAWAEKEPGQAKSGDPSLIEGTVDVKVVVA